MKTRWAVALAAAALMVSLQARAQVGPPSPGRNPQRTSDAIKTVLDLTDRQFSELNDLRDAHNQRLQDLSARMRDLDKQRRDAMAAGDNAALVGSLALQLQQLQQQMQDENKAYHDDALKILDGGQKEKVNQIEEALKLAPSAGALMQYGLLDTAQLPGGGARGGFLGSPGGMMPMRGQGMGPRGQPPPGQ